MELQADIIKFIQSISSPVFDYFFIFITNLGSEGFYFLLIPIFYWSIDKRMGIKLSSAILISMYVNTALKEITAVARPIGYPGIRSIYTSSAGGYSFPSGHAQGSTTIWGIIMFHYRKISVYILGTTIIILVSLSRLYLGVHWPVDIAGGIIVGLIIVLLTLVSGKFILPADDFIICAAALAGPAILLVIFPHPDVFKYMGMLSASWLGYLIEERFIGYEPKKTNAVITIVKYSTGAVGFLLIYAGLKEILPAGNIFSAARYFLLGLWLTAGAPYLFKKFFGT
ncbi:MAG: phosphatase PAP2 family protein [Tepidanaerobacteraceae bacterium]|jgi:membrane-associated phospholipid phosphatase|nr:phosphatase PAP2 family protein [Tepidanaerobacteraceae bacterium]